MKSHQVSGRLAVDGSNSTGTFQPAAGRRANRWPLSRRLSPSDAAWTKRRRMRGGADDARQVLKSSQLAGRWMLRSTVLALMDAGGPRSVADNGGTRARFRFTLAPCRNGDPP